MAFEFGSYTSKTDIISKIYNFVGSNGWTQEEISGVYCSFSKTINGVPCAFAIRFLEDELIAGGNVTQTHTGLAMTGATSITIGPSPWYNHPNNTKDQSLNSYTPVMGDLNLSGNYRLFANDEIICVIVETDGSADSDYGIMCFGLFGKIMGLVNHKEYSFITLNGPTLRFFCYLDGTWLGESSNESSVTLSELMNIFPYTFYDETTLKSLTAPLVASSPGKFKGNNQLAPIYIAYAATAANVFSYIGHIKGVFGVHAGNHPTDSEFSIGGDTYRVYRINKSAIWAIAILK